MSLNVCFEKCIQTKTFDRKRVIAWVFGFSHNLATVCKHIPHQDEPKIIAYRAIACLGAKY